MVTLQMVANQIRFLFDNLNDTNYDSVFSELCEYADCGCEGSILLLDACLDHMTYQGRAVQTMQLKPDFLAAIFRYLLNRPNFSTVICESLRNKIVTEELLGDVSKELCLSVFEKISVGLALSDSEDQGVRITGQNFCMAQIEELCSNPSQIDSNEQIQNIIMYLSRSEGYAMLLDSFMQMLSLLQLKRKTPLILAPLLSNDLQDTGSLRQLELFDECSENDFDAVLAEIEKEINMADTMKELGYNCTVNASHCREILSLFLPLTEVTLARLLSAIARTSVGLEDGQNMYSTFCAAVGCSSPVDATCLSSWNVGVLVDSIKQLAPNTNWGRVMENMDHEGVYFPSEEAFRFFMSVYSTACREPFPLHSICGHVWENIDGQLSFLRYAISAPAEIFTFTHAARQLVYTDIIHGQKLAHGTENQAWTCLDLLDVLCQLAERGHASSVRSMLEYPLKHCPEVVLLGMSHINTAFNLLQYEVMSSVLPIIVGNGSRSGIILHLWHANPTLVLRGFMDIHKDDPENMNEVLGICLELQILSSVLDLTPFSFSIKLAALAAGKEQLNLEKWLNDNLSINKDTFFEECLKFLNENPSGASQEVSASPFQHSVAVGNVTSEISSTFFKVLQSQAGQNISRQLFEEMKRLHVASMHTNPRLQNGGAPDSSTSDCYPDDIEAEANSYFHQMFSGQLTIDAMVQMLGRFKESSEKREVAIFNCMIANLFEEYKFFPKYPEMQLKFAAILFGSLIKNQLVTHLTLGIALRGVLDALRKSSDSKMFVFGVKALEQFLDRLKEWPQYCNHILQISHLRGTHPELVAFIEHALKRISSGGHPEPNSVASAVDQHQLMNQVTSENIEVIESPWKQGPSTNLPGQHLTSPLQTQQRSHGFFDDRQKYVPTSVSYVKPLASSVGQPLVSTSDVAGIPKVTVPPALPVVPSHNTTAVPTPPSGFMRPNRPTPPSSTGVPLRQHSYNTGFGSALNIETLVAAAETRDALIEGPASEIQDKILFMINNLSTANIEAKAREFTEVLKEEHYPWFAQYMVMKRASIEPNFHDLYLKFLDKVNSRDLSKEIIKATYENCKVLLRSELIKSSSEERSLLKNLGSWLGKFTIGRNQCLRAREIDPKALIIEAYEKGLMIAVIPFTSKVLEPCQSSLAYQPPNPWTMAILGLLSEIYALPNLKMNLKFDIEVLFKNLSLELKDVKPTSHLKDRIREVEGNPDFSNKDVGASQPQPHQQPQPQPQPQTQNLPDVITQVDMQPPDVAPQTLPGHSHLIPQYTTAIHPAPGLVVDDEKNIPLSLPLSERHASSQPISQIAPSQSSYTPSQLPTPIPNIRTQIKINQKLTGLGLTMHFQSILPGAMERAIKEIMTPVVQRSVTIAMQSTRELVLKDFAMESDESRISNAAHLMVASLAASLAHVTCKEPLRVSISSHLRNSLQSLNIANDLLEHAVQLVTNDNLDLGCAAVEHAASEKAEQTIDAEIHGQLAIRRKHRESVGSTYFDASTYTQGPMGIVPESLRPKPGRLSLSQQRVYEDFARYPWQNQPSQSSNPPMPPGLPASGPYGSNPGQPNSIGGSVSGFSTAVAQPLDLISEEIDNTSTAQLLNVPDNSEINPVPSTGAIPEFTEKARQSRDKKESLAVDTTGFREQVTLLFTEWCRICEMPSTNEASSHSQFIAQIQHLGLLKTDEMSDRFYRILTEISVSNCISSEISPSPSSHQQHLSFIAIDMYAKLVSSILKYGAALDQSFSEIPFLSKILSVTVRVVQKDSDDKKTGFNPRPYFRLFINWLLDLASEETPNFQVLTAFANTFLSLQPLKVPGFSFTWLELISHRCFMPKLLNNPKGLPLFQLLLAGLFKFMEPYLRNAELREPVQILYKGTLRVLLVLLHDFPEFLCNYHFSFCDVIPPSCIQMRNVILSAFPRNMRLPDPSTPNLKIDLLPEITHPPSIFSDVDAALKAKQMKAEIDEYLKTKPAGSTLMTDMKQRLMLTPFEATQAGTRFNVPLINSLVLYVGMQAINQLQPKTTPMDIFSDAAVMEIFQKLINELDTEGRYLFLNAIANQLRYPNNHTHYFSFMLLYLFAEAETETIQEQITRVLLERLIVNRPHPWGLLITFIELIKNPRYNFWGRPFTRIAPEIEKLFESVSRSCGGPKSMDESLISVGIPESSH